MYISTFYSFKGGVGRTMALVNVAVWLAKRGKNVLLIDFDLEAPGLDTFPLLRPKSRTPGIVDYVSYYLKHGQAADVTDYVVSCESVENLSIMPSGLHGSTYAQNFAQIEWRGLYAKQDGFLLFEDLKEQWRQSLQADYVLIDSRTGYTDTGGICTRQLPDAVVILFFPNEQNLRGLGKVVSDIRSESEPPREKTIDLHFVMSNVPDLDDEDNILRDIKTRFQRDLDFTQEPMTIHRYESLSLLNQTVFADQRPKSRLAKEYRNLAHKIVDRNLAGRDAALRVLRRARFAFEGLDEGSDSSALNREELLKEIEDYHSNDGEVVFHLGQLAAKDGLLENARSLLDRSIELGYQQADAYIERARIHERTKNTQEADADAKTSLMRKRVPMHLVLQAIRLLDESSNDNIADLPAVKNLDAEERFSLASKLSQFRANRFAVALLEQIIDDHNASKELSERARSKLASDFIYSGEYDRAIELLTIDNRDVQSMQINDAFSYAMAEWARTGNISHQLFEFVATLDDATDERRNDANYRQCLALTHWAIGNDSKAKRYAESARNQASNKRMVFSFWRYCEVPGRVFLEDVAELLKMIDGDADQTPRFMKEGNPDQ